MDYKKLNKKAMSCMYVKSWITSFVMIIILLVGRILLNDIMKSNLHPTWYQVVCGVIYGFVAFFIIYSSIAPKIRYNRYQYLLTDEEFAVRKGLVIIKNEIVPIERLHKIEVSSGPIFRAFGLKEIKVTTAGGEIKVDYLDDAVAEEIANSLKTRINTIAVEEKDGEK